MRKLILIAALAFLGTSAHAGPSRGLVLAATESIPAAVPAAPGTPAAQTAQAVPAQATPATPPAAQTPAPAKADKAQAIFEQLVKHGVIKLPNQTPAAATTTTTTAPAPATAATPAPAPVAATSASAPATTAQPVATPVAPAPAASVPAAKVTTSEPKKMSQAEIRIRSELRRHGIR